MRLKLSCVIFRKVSSFRIKLTNGIPIGITIISFLFSGCFDPLAKYKKNELHEIKDKVVNAGIYEELSVKNQLNINNNFPFYVIRLKAPLFLEKPENPDFPDSYIMLSFGDILFPVKESDPVKNFFYVKTASGKYGWIQSNFGISLNFNEDTNLYFFNNSYYIKSYLSAGGAIDKANKLILIKNIVPMLLGNFSTPGWFYPADYDLAMELSKFAVDISENEQVFFYTAFSVQYWRYNEIVIANNLLADCYQKIKNYAKAEEIHQMLIKKYFWQKSYNSEIGGLTSIIKLQIMYLEQLNNEKIGSEKYNYFKNKIIDSIITVVNDKGYNTWTSKDMVWKGGSFPEWILDILRKHLSRDEFYDFCNALIAKTDSEGFTDMASLYIALEKIKEGKREEAIQFLSNYKPKHDHPQIMKLDDWLSANKILPDSIIYRYNFN